MRAGLKRLAMVLSFVLLFTFVFMGCSKTGTNETSGKDTVTTQAKNTVEDAKKTEATAAKEPVKLVVWGAINEAQGPKILFDKWNAANPNIQVEYVSYVNDAAGNTKMDTALLSGEQIDAFYSYTLPLMAKRIQGKMSEDLTPFGIVEFMKTEFGLEDGYKYEGKIYSLPTNKDPAYIMMNKGLLDKLNIKVPGKWTFEEYREMAKKLTFTDSEGAKHYGVHHRQNDFDKFARIILGSDLWYKNGGSESNFDHPAFKETYSFYYDLMYTDESAFPYTEVLARKMQVYAQEVFLKQEVGMVISQPWMLRYIKDLEKYPHDWVTTFAPVPVPDNTGDYWNPGLVGSWLLMNSKSNYKEETWELMKYISTEGSRDMMLAGKLPIWNKLSEEEILKGLLGDNAEKLFDIEAFRRVAIDADYKLVNDTISVAAPQIQQIVNEEADKYYLKGQTADEFIKALKTRADVEIKNAAK